MEESVNRDTCMAMESETEKKKIPVLIDSDGQIDSLWGLILAKRRLDVKAVTVCSGKTGSLKQAAANVLGFCGMAGLDSPVSAGGDRTVLDREKPVWNRFGGDGKCGLPLPAVTKTCSEERAWDRIYKEARECGGELTVLCFGPMTNLAISLFKYPDLPGMLKKIIFVGGSYDFGNYDRVTEINMATDPEAAKAVFDSGVRLEMYGCHLERETALSNEEVSRIVDHAKGAHTTAFLMNCMACPPGEPVAYLPPLAVLGMTSQGAVDFERYHVLLETKSSLCRGRTTVFNMYTPIGYPKDTKVAMRVDKEAFVREMKEALAAYEIL